jgi:hypothetical protein
MFKVNYRSEAGLYHPVQRGSKPGQAGPIGYKRFKTVAAATASRLSSSPAISWTASLWKSAITADAPPHRHVPYWHSSDITPALTNVRYRG